MEKLVNMVAEQAGISNAQAQAAVTAVEKFLTDKMPPAMAAQVESYLKGEGPAGDISGMADKLGGMFGKK